MEKEFVLLQESEEVIISLSEEETPAVWLAAKNLASDIKKVCDCNVVLIKSEECEKFPSKSKKIRIASWEIWESKNHEKQTCVLDTNLLKENSGERRWEAYLHQVIGETFYIVGSDRRGTVYGIYELSSQLGISPWYYWADVPAKKRSSFCIPNSYLKVDWPGVAYRGIFLNDEEELEAWAKKHTKDNTIGPEVYMKIYELILRLKGNYLWPAMHVNYFNENPENARLADEAGIVIGSSHCDMMLRSNQNEWKPWLARKGYQDVKYDYSISGENRERLKEYWSESAAMYREYDASYTVGMRGIHDSGFVTERIDKNSSLRMEEKRQEKVRLLGEVIQDQRHILQEVLGQEKAKDVLQLFIPYKEVLSLYDNGLKLPEDITLMWVDDNFGYMRRYPNGKELKRCGGHGLYYHASYWAPPGMSYLFYNSIPLAHTGNELKKCYESGIKKVWVLNVGALKPLEIDMEFFLQYGWEAGKEEGETKDTDKFMEKWFERTFSGDYAKEVAVIYNQFTQVTNVCKLEHMQSDKFSQTAYEDEAERRMLKLKNLLKRADIVYQGLPEKEKDAFYELIYMKIEASYAINASFYYADRSRLSYNRGAMQAADYYLEMSRKMDFCKRSLIHYYNHELQGGKWEGIMTPESFLPPPTVLYPAAKPALVIDEPELDVVGKGEEIRFSLYGDKQKSFEIYNRGCESISVKLKMPEWLQASFVEGKVQTSQKVWIWLKEEKEDLFLDGVRGNISILGELGEQYDIPVQVMQETPLKNLPEGCYVEAEGYVSVPADGHTSIHTKTEHRKAEWRKICYMGRGEGAAMEVCFDDNVIDSSNQRKENFAEERTEEVPALEYLFYLKSEGAFLLEISRFLTLNSTGNVRMAVAVDDFPFLSVSSPTIDEWTGNWEGAVMNNGEKLYVRLPYLKKGVHRLKIGAIDQYVTITKWVIYTYGWENSNLGPDFSTRWTGELYQREDFKQQRIEEIYYEDVMKETYAEIAEHVELLPVLYGDPLFWTVGRLYTRSDEKKQECLGRQKYLPDSRGKKNVFTEFLRGPYEEQDGKIMLEAEYALANAEYAWLTPAFNNKACLWSHTQAETDGGNGLAMMIERRGLLWEKAEEAPGMHYQIKIRNQGNYHVWLLIKFEDMKSDACVFALDGRIQDKSQQYSGGNQFCYSMKQRWHWQAISDMKLTEGIHTFSILGRKSGLRIDRIYITQGEEWPPIDSEWENVYSENNTKI